MAKKKKVLLATNDAQAEVAIKAALERDGCEVISSNDGSHASYVIQNTPVDAAILQIKLPSMSGLHLASVLRSRPGPARGATFMLGDPSDQESIAKAKQLGVADVFLRPYQPDVIAAKVAAKIKPSKTYDVRILNCFIDAATEIMHFYLGTQIEIGKASIKRDSRALGYVSGLISLVSNKIQGSLSITCDRPFITALARKVFQGQELMLDDAMISDLAGEMSNQICGKVKINLAKLGMTFHIGIPKVVLGEGHSISHMTSSPVISLPIKAGSGACHLEFCMAEGADQDINEEKAEQAPVTDILLF